MSSCSFCRLSSIMAIPFKPSVWRIAEVYFWHVLSSKNRQQSFFLPLDIRLHAALRDDTAFQNSRHCKPNSLPNASPRFRGLIWLSWDFASVLWTEFLLWPVAVLVSPLFNLGGECGPESPKGRPRAVDHWKNCLSYAQIPICSFWHKWLCYGSGTAGRACQ